MSLSRNEFAGKAYAWGIEDGMAGVERRGWEYFIDGGVADNAYNLGYLVGLARQPKRLAGGSEFDGYSFFVGANLTEYREGFSAGRIINGRLGQPWKVAFDNGASADGGCSLPSDRSEERTRIIRDQVRFAKTQGERQDALNAAMEYSPGVYDMLAHMYPVYELAVQDGR